jgi:tetratricopeptide (TPR) repeat protein
MSLTSDLQNAFRSYQSGAFNEAEALCAKVRAALPSGHPDVLRLSGMVARKRGDQRAARDFLQRSLALAPAHPETLNVLGLVQIDAGKPDEAADVFRQALSAKPDYGPAKLNLARALKAAGRESEALKVYAAITQTAGASDHVRAEHAELEIHSGHAENALDLLPENSTDAEISYARLHALSQLQRDEEALQLGRRILSMHPNHVPALRACAQLLWMTQGRDAVDDMFEQALQDGGGEMVYLRYMKALIQMEDYEAAQAVGERARKALGQHAVLENLFADAQVEAGQGAAALASAQRATALAPQDLVVASNLARAQLMTGDGAGALATARQARARVPNDQFWIAMEGDALCLLGDPAYHDLMRFEDLARPFKLEAPEGYADIQAFNAALLDRLDHLHRYARHPLDQSLRLGSQTSLDLKRSEDPVFKAFFQALDAPIRAYMALMPDDDRHPLFRRKTGNYQLSGAWSVKLGPDGRHVSHVHPEGWISSAYYVHVPEQVAGAPDREGWIEYGIPPFAVPGMDKAQRAIEPAAGTLALFPSYMWHGTRKIRSGNRITIAFDVVPV